LDSGEGVSHTIPIFEGYSIPHAIQRVPLAGKHVTEYLKSLLLKVVTSVDSDVARDIKERHCYASTNYDEAIREGEISHGQDKPYDLPDGKKVLLSTERFKAPELLFQPTLAGYELDGLPKYCFDSIMKCDVEARKELFQNVILAGGNTLFEGMGEKMWQELHQLAPSSTKIKMLAPPERRFSAWLGGSILASLSTF
jgi:actin-related protein